MHIVKFHTQKHFDLGAIIHIIYFCSWRTGSRQTCFEKGSKIKAIWMKI